jgi:hypothetical protein
MKSADDIRHLFKNSELGVNPETDERVFEDVRQAQQETTEKVPAMPEIWRIIMKSRRAQFTAAAMVVLITYLCIQIPKSLVAPTYALDDTIEAYNSIRILHVKEFRTVCGQRWDAESWIEFDENGKPKRFRYETNRVSTGDEIGPVTVVNDGNGSYTWLPKLNLGFKRSGESVIGSSLVQWEVTDAAPKLVFEKLQKQARDGEIILDVNEPVQKNEPIVLVVTYPDESRSVNWKKVLYIDQATRLVEKEEKFEKRDGQFQHERTAEFFDYNKQIDPERFSLDKELPETAFTIDQSGKEVGLAQGDMTDEEIAEEVTLQFLKAANTGDFNKVGQLYLGIPAFLVEKLSGGGGGNEFKIISVGPVHSDPDPDSNVLECPCKAFGETGGQYYVFDMTIHVQPVSGQPGRWMVCGTTSYAKPAPEEMIPIEFEPTTEEKTRGFVAVQGSGPKPRPRMNKVEVDLGRNERDLVPVKLVSLSELDAVSISISGPGAAFCTPWIEKDCQLHVGDQALLRLPNPARIWLEVDSHQHDPGAYELTIHLSSGQGTELRIPGIVTIYDVALPEQQTVGMDPRVCVVGLSWWANYKPEARKRLEVFLDDLAMLRSTVCGVFYTYNPANVQHQVKIAGTDQTLHNAGQAGLIDINNLPDLDFSFFDPWIAGAAQRGMTHLEINGRLHLSEHERAFANAVLGNDIVCSDEITWKTLMWLHSQFRDYAISRGMTETWAKIDTQLTPETIPDYVQTARRYQKIGYRTYMDNVDHFAKNATHLNQLNAQNDSWYMSYGHTQEFLVLTRPTQGKAAVPLDEGDQVWYYDGGNYNTPYEEGRRKAWRACAIGVNGYTWWTYWSDNSKDQLVWYDPKKECIIHSPTWHGLRDGNEDAAYYYLLQQRLQARGDQAGLARLASLTGKTEDAPLRMVEIKHQDYNYDDFDGTIGFRQFNQAKREVLRMLCADQ